MLDLLCMNFVTPNGIVQNPFVRWEGGAPLTPLLLLWWHSDDFKIDLRFVVVVVCSRGYSEIKDCNPYNLFLVLIIQRCLLVIVVIVLFVTWGRRW